MEVNGKVADLEHGQISEITMPNLKDRSEDKRPEGRYEGTKMPGRLRRL
jgi:hypothetical protein